MSFIDVSANWIPLGGGASNYKNSLQPVINLANSGMSIGTLQCLFNSQLNTNGNYLSVSNFDVSSNITLIVDTSNGGGLFSSFIKDGSGTLQLNIAGSSFACDISHNNGLINFNTYGDCIYYSKLSGTGTVNKNGSGNLTIINDNTNYTGTINVNSGKLTVNGTMSSTSKIIVNNGATLTGTGTVGNVTICTSGNIMASGGTNGLTINAVSCLQPLVAGSGVKVDTSNNSTIVSLTAPNNVIAFVLFNLIGSVADIPQGNILSAKNIARVARNSDATYDIYFQTPMTDTNYVAIATAGSNLTYPLRSTVIMIVNRTINNVRIGQIGYLGETYADYSPVNLIIFK